MDLATRRMIYYGLLGLLIAGSTITVFRVVPQVAHTSFLVKNGTVSIYFARVPSEIQSNNVPLITGLPFANLLTSRNVLDISVIVSLDITVDSVMIHSNEANDTGWIEISHSSITLDLFKPTSDSVLIASAKVPEQNITMVVLRVSNPSATVNLLGVISPMPVVVSSSNLRIPLGSGASVKAQMTTSITADRPHIVVEGNGQIRLTPVLSVNNISGPK